MELYRRVPWFTSVREFTSDYLDRTRRGMWSSGLEGFDAVEFDDVDRAVDVGCGTGVLTRMLRQRVDGDVVAVDFDRELLEQVEPPVVRGAAGSLPFRDDVFDAVVCQALLVNLTEPMDAVEEFARVSCRYLVSVEPDNGEATVESTVEGESEVARRTRRRYVDGVSSDVALGGGAAELFEDAGAEVLSVERYLHELVLEPPYGEEDVRAVERKATGEAFEERRREMTGDEEMLDGLREEWRRVGREAARQMEDGGYRRRDVVPFYVVVAEL